MAVRLICCVRKLLIPRFGFNSTGNVIMNSMATQPSKKLLGKAGKLGPLVEKKRFPAETDTHKLLNYVCGSNYFKEGEDIKLKEDAEYPDWLWTLRLGPPPPLEELDPNTLVYWRRVRKLAIRRNRELAKTRRF